MKVRFRVLPCALVASTLVVSCGDDDEGAADSSDPTTAATQPGSTRAAASKTAKGECPVSEAEVSAALGTTVTARAETEFAGGHTCEFDFEDNGLAAVPTYTSDVMSSYNASLNVASDDDPVSGVGDKAAFSPTLGTLFAVVGDIGLQVQILRPAAHRGEFRDATISLATTVSGRL